MKLMWRRCTTCGRKLKASECLRLDDPQAPFGPEWLCPHCEDLTAPKYHPALLLIAAVIAGTVGFAVGTLLSRL